MREKITANNTMKLDESNRTQQDEQSRPDRVSGRAASRRQFLGLAASAASGLALSRLTPDLWAQNACTAHQGQPLAAIGEIKSNGTVLQGIVDLTVQERAVSYYNAPIFGCDTHHLRAYQGYRGFALTDPVFTKAQMAVEGPGPTFRIGVGETMEVIFLNRIDPSQFGKSSVTSVYGQCDTVVGAGAIKGVAYPGADATNFPNCFHGSNTTNLHWHGTHTSPNAFADNVLLSVIPDAKLNVAAAIAQCKQAYAAWASGQDPTKTLVAAATANLNSMYQAAVASKNQNLAVQLKAAVQNDHSETGATPPEFPQFWPGVFPYRFELPKWSGSLQQAPRMGQSPGTHWYHCHQHGSTTMQLLNGMAGALIITDESPTGYDGCLKKLGYAEHVMVLQLFSEQPNQLNASPSFAQVVVNGQIVPQIAMQQGEVQWWRVVNACMQAHGIEDFVFLDQATYTNFVSGGTGGATIPLNGGAPPTGNLPTPARGSTPSLNQCAQDGVQLAWENFQKFQNAHNFQMAPGNRSDFLVQAPAKPGNYYLVFWPAVGRAQKDIRANTILQVVVGTGTSNLKLPTQAQYPPLPGFLADITAAEVHGRSRQVDFSMIGGPGSQPTFLIDGAQFQEGIINQTMMKDTAEEWLLTNSSVGAISHPFHIHINPFQVIEVYDPATMPTPVGQQPDPNRDALKLPQPWVWWDVISIPAAAQPKDTNGKLIVDANGKPVIVNGHIRFRSRFTDFIGKYVLHCHILGHEDRGMMQMVQVVDNHTIMKHH